MKIEKDDNLPRGYRILGSNNNWDIEEDKLCICVSDVNILPLSEDDVYITVYGEGPRQIAEDIIKLSRNSDQEELGTLRAENEALKETIGVLQRQLEKEKRKRDDMINTFKSELEQVKKEKVRGADNDKDALDARTYSILPIMERSDNDDIKGYDMAKFKTGDVVKITDGRYKGLVGIIDGEKMQMRDFLTNHELIRYPVNLGGPNHICMLFSPWDLSLVDHNKEGLCELQGEFI